MPNETLQERLVGITQGAQQREKRQTPLASDPRPGSNVLARFGFDVELDPLATVRVHGARHDRLRVPTRLEDHPRGTDELRYDNALGAVDDESAAVRHHGEVMKTVCSLISPVLAFWNCARTKMGAA